MTVDVLLPHYGDLALVQEAIASVMAQTDPDWRLVIANDDLGNEAAKEWFESLDDPRIEYHLNEENLGVNGNFRKVLSLATNPLCQIMGSDDVMQPTYVEWLVAAADSHPDVDVFQPGVLTIDENGVPSDGLVEKVKRHYAPDTDTPVVLAAEDFAVSVLKGDWLYFPSIGWRTETIKRVGFREGVEIAEDLALLVEIAAEGGALYFDPRLQFLYRRHSASASSKNTINGARFDEERELFDEFARQMKAKGWDRAARAASIHFSSRGHAATAIPKAIATRNWDGLKALLRHVAR